MKQSPFARSGLDIGINRNSVPPPSDTVIALYEYGSTQPRSERNVEPTDMPPMVYGSISGI